MNESGHVFGKTRPEYSYRPEELAEKAYSAYSSSLGNVDHTGNRAVPWQNLPTAQKTAWMAATHVVVTNANAIDSRTGLTEREAELAGKSPAAAAERREEAQAAAAEQKREDAEDAKEEAREKNSKAHGAHK
jgi:hypothetical protein